MKKIVFIISFSVILFLGLQNIGMVGNAIKWIFYLFVPLLMGFCIAFILNVLMKIMEGKWFSFLNHKNYKFWKIIKRPLCLLLTIGMVVGILFILLFLLIPELKKTFDIMVTNFPVYFSKIQSWIEDFIVSSSISEETLAFLQIDWNEVSKSIGESFKNISSKFLLSTVSFTTSIFGTVVNIVLALVFAVYMLLQKEKLSSQARKILYSYLPMDRADKLVSFGSLSYRTFSRFVSGQFLEAIIIGILCFLGMLVFSMPYASMISVLVGFTALIPMVGAFIGTAIGDRKSVV